MSLSLVYKLYGKPQLYSVTTQYCKTIPSVCLQFQLDLLASVPFHVKEPSMKRNCPMPKYQETTLSGLLLDLQIKTKR